MDAGPFANWSRQELLEHLETWNAELRRNHALPVVEYEAASDMPMADLRLVVEGTSARLASVAAAVGRLR